MTRPHRLRISAPPAPRATGHLPFSDAPEPEATELYTDVLVESY
jgi:hypothetical protein